MSDTIRTITLYSSFGILGVLGSLLLVLIIITLLTRKKLARFEDDCDLYFMELYSFLESSSEPIPEDFFSKKISNRYNYELLTAYIQDQCLRKKNAHITRLKEYAKSCGLIKHLRAQSSHGNKWKRAVAIRILSEIGDQEDVTLFRKIVETKHFHPEVMTASIGLANNGITDCIKLSIEKSYNHKKPNRDEVLSMLSYFDDSAIEPCIELVKDKDIILPLRTTLIDFLGVKKAYAAKSLFEDILKAEGDNELDIHLIEALEKIGDEGSCDTILLHAEDSDFRVRLKAVNALERLAKDKYIDTAKKMLADPDMFVRRNAAEAISRMGERGLELLRELKSSKNRDIAVISGMVLAEKKYGKIRWRFRYGDSIP